MGEDRRGLGRPLALALLILREQLLGLVAQLRRFVEFGADPGAPFVERAEQRFARRFPDRDDKDHRGDQDPEFGIGEKVHQRARSARAPSTAAAIRAASGADPVSFSTTARPTSTATPRISASAWSLPSAMRRSASAICCIRVAESSRWRSAASAAMRSLITPTVACTSPPAVATIL